MEHNLLKKLETINLRYQNITQQLSDSTVLQDFEEFKKLSKEYAQLKPIQEQFELYRKLQHHFQQNDLLLKDTDETLQELAKEERTSLVEEYDQVVRRIQELLIPVDPNDNRNTFLEIRAAAGGAEASIFAGDLLRMYLRYAEKQDWKTEVISSHPSEQGGYKEVVVRLSGTLVYSHLKFESGAHRVQRVPTTETQGRLHTSTCTVAVLPETENIDEITIHPDELRIDTFRASGAGGQHVQKTDSAIRITHLPTGTTVECQDERSQHKNRARAMSLLHAKLFAQVQEKQQQEAAATRRSLIGSGDRSERIRTYNLPQGRLTDHRINLTLYQLHSILEGELSLVIEPLKKYAKLEQLESAKL